MTISPSVQLVLVATVVGAIALLLRAEPVESPLPFPAPTPATQTPAARVAYVEDKPWARPRLPGPPTASARAASSTPPLPAPHAKADADANVTPPLPPLPVTPNQPDVVYLGRIVKDGIVQVFFASNGDPAVLRTGEVLNGTWRVQSISTESVTLRHLQTNETRLIATGGNAPPRPGGVAAGQVGQNFIASHPLQQQLIEQVNR